MNETDREKAEYWAGMANDRLGDIHELQDQVAALREQRDGLQEAVETLTRQRDGLLELIALGVLTGG